MSDSGLVVAEQLTKHYAPGLFSGKRQQVARAVDGVDLRIGRGESFGIVGESGSGKSTLARLIVGLERPTSGRLLVAGADLGRLRKRELRQWRRNVQMVFQDPYSSLNPRMRVGGIVAEPLRIHHLSSRVDQDRRVAEVLGSVALTSEFLPRRPRELSGGQRQRVAIARALALQPTLVICDEPVSSLDVSIQAQVLNVLASTRDLYGVTYVFISHDLAVVRHFCDRVAVMYLGRIVEQGPLEAVYASPAHPYTCALLSAEPQAPFATPRSRPRIRLKGDIPSATSIPSGCRFRTRCWKAQEVCAAVDPPLVEKADARAVACHFPEA